MLLFAAAALLIALALAGVIARPLLETQFNAIWVSRKQRASQISPFSFSDFPSRQPQPTLELLEEEEMENNNAIEEQQDTPVFATLDESFVSAALEDSFIEYAFIEYVDRLFPDDDEDAMVPVMDNNNEAALDGDNDDDIRSDASDRSSTDLSLPVDVESVPAGLAAEGDN